MSFTCTTHSVCFVLKCIYVSAPNTRHEFVPHDMHPARVYETICCHVNCLQDILDIYVAAPNTLGTCMLRMICNPHEFVSTRYGMIQFHLETICCHVICLHETLDVYCNDMYLCFCTKHSRYVFVPHDMYPARVLFDTIRYDTILSREDMLSCHLSARNTRYVL
jgi:hypothetical protein